MSADITCYNNSISRFGIVAGCADTIKNFSNTCCRNKDTVHLTLSGNLRITRYNADTGLFGCFLHRTCDLFQFLHRKTFFNNKGTGKI